MNTQLTFACSVKYRLNCIHLYTGLGSFPMGLMSKNLRPSDLKRGNSLKRASRTSSSGLQMQKAYKPKISELHFQHSKNYRKLHSFIQIQIANFAYSAKGGSHSIQLIVLPRVDNLPLQSSFPLPSVIIVNQLFTSPIVYDIEEY